MLFAPRQVLRTASTLVALSILACRLWAQAPATTELNLANQAELEQIAGLGPQMAERLLQARRERLFRDWIDAQQRVKGLGPVSAKRLSEHGLRINGQAWGGPTPLSSSSPP